MEIAEAVELLQPGRSPAPGPHTWADLGCGNGLFTKALAQLLDGNSTIYAIDTSVSSLKEIPASYNGCHIIKLKNDFVADPLPFTDLDGVLMANAIHFVADKRAFITKAFGYMKSVHQWVIVEYDTNEANRWVPFPISFQNLRDLFAGFGYNHIKKLSERPSVFGHANIYSAGIFR